MQTKEEWAKEIRASWELANALKTHWHTPEELSDLEKRISQALEAYADDRVANMEANYLETIGQDTQTIKDLRRELGLADEKLRVLVEALETANSIIKEWAGITEPKRRYNSEKLQIYHVS